MSCCEVVQPGSQQLCWWLLHVAAVEGEGWGWKAQGFPPFEMLFYE